MGRTLLAAVLLAVSFHAAAQPLRGDANNNGAIESLDIFSVINAVHADSAYACRSDADSDRDLTTLDADFLVAMHFTGGPAPVQATETCNGFDDNCDDTVDEAVDACFVAAFGHPPAPAQEDSIYETEIRSLDAYVLLDRSGSMTAEVTAFRNNMATVANNVRCQPAGAGTPGQCFEDLWLGAGTIGYRGTNGQPYVNHLDLQPFPNFASVPATEPSGCCSEAFYQALYSTATALGSAAMPGCLASAYAARASCVGSPAAGGGFGTAGYPCFRNSAVKFAFVVTDEAPSANSPCPALNTVLLAARSIGLRIAGVVGTGGDATTRSDLQTLATSTGAIDSENAPLVFDGADNAAPTALQTALVTIASGIPLNIRAAVHDDPADGVNTVAAFVDHIETIASGTPECTNTLVTADEDENGFPETYQSAITGTPLCWRLVLKQNNSVAATAQPQIFPATVRILGVTDQLLYERPILFVVPR